MVLFLGGGGGAGGVAISSRPTVGEVSYTCPVEHTAVVTPPQLVHGQCNGCHLSGDGDGNDGDDCGFLQPSIQTQVESHSRKKPI